MASCTERSWQRSASKCARRRLEYLISRDVKYVHLYKKALAINKQAKANEEEEWPRGDKEEAQEALSTRPSDVDLYERRTFYCFWPTDTPPSPHLPQQTTPEEQVSAASLWDFFRLVRFKGADTLVWSGTTQPPGPLW